MPKGSGYSNHRDGEMLPSKGGPTTCELCHRDVERYTVHHLIPRSRGGKSGPTARLCPTCHRQLHALFSETTLAQELYTIDLLQANPRVSLIYSGSGSTAAPLIFGCGGPMADIEPGIGVK